MGSAECFTSCCLGPPAANPEPNTLGQRHTGDTGETPKDPPPSPLPEALFSMGRANKSFPPYRKTWSWRGGGCKDAHGKEQHRHGQRLGTHTGMDTEPQQLQAQRNSSFPRVLAQGGTFPCHKHPGRASLPWPLPTRPRRIYAAVAAGCYNISPKHLNSSSLV